MAIPDPDIKMLWGRAAGMCSKPGCGADLTRPLEGGKHYVVGEMAHVIAQAERGPRGIKGGGTDTYDNLILLCPTCHRDIDKAPDGTFSADELKAWKQTHEERVSVLGSEERFASIDELRKRISLLLAENHGIWANYGPKSDAALADPMSNLYKLWEIRRADRIVPNNRRIINILRANQALLNKQQIESFGKFLAHAEAYEQHVHDRLDRYPLFPSEFEAEFR